MTIRSTAKDWLRLHHPMESSHEVRSSKYYIDHELWFFTFPATFFGDKKSGYVNILLQDRIDPGEFHYLRVPFAFFRQNKSKFDVRSKGDKFDLHISAKAGSWLTDERSSPGVKFAEFEVMA